MYKLIVRPFLFLFDPEKIHYVAFSLIRFLCKVPLGALIFRKIYQIEDKRLERKLFGITFKNPVGLAAGFDKNAVLFNELANFGFGFIEIHITAPAALTKTQRIPDDSGPSRAILAAEPRPEPQQTQRLLVLRRSVKNSVWQDPDAICAPIHRVE